MTKFLIAEPSSQYVISLRAFNNFGKGLVVYDLVYTREETGPTVGPLSSPIGLRSRVLSPKTVWLEWTDPSLGTYFYSFDPKSIKYSQH